MHLVRSNVEAQPRLKAVGWSDGLGIAVPTAWIECWTQMPQPHEFERRRTLASTQRNGNEITTKMTMRVAYGCRK